MRKILLRGLVPGITLSAGLVLSSPLAAVTQSRLQSQTGADMCTLSVPTIDSKVRPRATGFRNEGTTNAFVICTFDPPPGANGIVTDFIYAILVLKSLDGADHDVTCTAVNSLPNMDALGWSDAAQQYIAKTMTVNDSGTFKAFGTGYQWFAEDFGATDAIPYSGGQLSVTCLLPPQVSVIEGVASSSEDVGN